VQYGPSALLPCSTKRTLRTRNRMYMSACPGWSSGGKTGTTTPAHHPDCFAPTCNSTWSPGGCKRRRPKLSISTGTPKISLFLTFNFQKSCGQ
ncbi:hypothetical protein AAFF_G00208160, partial [Aldrovandia affinis]